MFLGVILLVNLGCIALSQLAGCLEPISSQKELLGQIYATQLPAKACVRLLNNTGPVGCASPPRSLQTAQLSSVEVSASGQQIPVVALEELKDFAVSLQSDTQLQSSTEAILVTPGEDATFSSADQFPLEAYAPYDDATYPWNSLGNGLARQQLDLPVFLIDNGSTHDAAVAGAASNTKQDYTGALHMAEVEAGMEAQGNSSACLAARSCLPIGGHSIWAAIPPLTASEIDGTASSGDALPITLVLASIDSTAFFQPEALGAETSLSGLLAMLGVAEVLGNSSAPGAFQRRIVFMALAGEPWGYMGSRRLLWAMHKGQESVSGLPLHHIDQIVEMGQTGWPAGSRPPTFYLHSQRGSEWGNVSALRTAFQGAAGNGSDTRLPANLELASQSNPGIPPSSLMSFLRANRSIAGVVLADFDTAFKNPDYQSYLDGLGQISVDSVAAATRLTAMALYSLAAGPHSASLQVDEEAVLSTLRELVSCLVQPEPGLTCPLVKQLMSATQGTAEHYLTVLRSPTADDQDPDPAAKSDMERFIWNFLALRTSLGPGRRKNPGKDPDDVSCNPYKQPCSNDSSCVAWKFDEDTSNGRCVHATVRYVPSYSLRFDCKGCDGSTTFYDPDWQMTDVAEQWQKDLGWPPDPEWTESNWQRLRLRIFKAEPEGRERAILILGLIVTLLAGAGVVTASAAHSKAMQR